MRYTVDAVAGLAFGAEVNTLESEADVIQQHLDKIFPAVFRRMFAAMPTWRWWKSAADRELDRSVATVAAAIQGFIAAARRRLEDPARARAEEPARGHDRRRRRSAVRNHADEVHGNVLTMLLAEEADRELARLDDLAAAQHPDCLARARAEIDERVGAPRRGRSTTSAGSSTSRPAPTRRCGWARSYRS
jgi:hypothetical protein